VINVIVRSLCRHSLSSLATLYDVEVWTSEYSEEGWSWEYEFPTEELAQNFIADLPEGCTGEIQIIN
jgi:hypothetical protein